MRINTCKSRFSLLLTAGLLFVLHGSAQVSDPLKEDSTSVNYTLRKRLVIGSGVVTGVGSYAALYMAWYNDYNTGQLHSFDDNGEWLQMDKVGHVMTASHLGMISINALRWAGVDEKTSRWVGGSTGLLYQTGIEVMDGFSEGWGFSWGDQAANVLGAASVITQDIVWNEQRIKLKYSSYPTEFARTRPELFGTSFPEQLLKDYNGQTYWASVNIHSFLKEESNFPKWVNIALGYGGHNMLGGHNNPPEIAEEFGYEGLRRTRQFYLSLDIDLTQIETQSQFLKSLFQVVGFIKIPSPTLELQDDGTFIAHPFFF